MACFIRIYKDNYKIQKCVGKKPEGIGIFPTKDVCGLKLWKRDKPQEEEKVWTSWKWFVKAKEF